MTMKLARSKCYSARERERVGEVARVGRRELVGGIGHAGARIAGEGKHNKNEGEACWAGRRGRSRRALLHCALTAEKHDKSVVRSVGVCKVSLKLYVPGTTIASRRQLAAGNNP